MSARLRWWLHDLQPATAREVRRNVVGALFIVVALVLFLVANHLLTGQQAATMYGGGMSK